MDLNVLHLDRRSVIKQKNDIPQLHPGGNTCPFDSQVVKEAAVVFPTLPTPMSLLLFRDIVMSEAALGQVFLNRGFSSTLEDTLCPLEVMRSSQV